MMLEKMDLLA
jgi:hypothetical protein